MVGWDTVSVHNGLEHVSQIGDLVEGWWGDSVVALDASDLGGSLVGKSLADVLLVLSWSPEVSNESSTLLLHHVERLVKSLLLSQEHLVDEDGRRSFLEAVVFVDVVEVNQLLTQLLSGAVKHVSLVLDGVSHSLDLLAKLVELWEVKSLARE